MKRFSGGFLISVSLSATDLLCLIKKFDIWFTQIQVNSFQTMSASFGDSHDLESPGGLEDCRSNLVFKNPKLRDNFIFGMLC